MAPLAGKKVIVIGGSSGIGYGVAKAALAEGAHVVISSSDPEKVAAAAKRLDAGDRLTAEVMNVADEAQVKALFDKVGTFDHVVTTVGASLAVSVYDIH
jgi:NAD(P)-dependent dehydrogenase (short-subunit alcohol dehydrogenase family)